jgi:membrane-associated phospholipid phosphatase
LSVGNAPTDVRAGAVEAVRGMQPVDRLFVAYLVLDTVVLLARAGRIGSWPWLAAANGLAALLVALLARARRGRVLDALGAVYPVLLAPLFYTGLGVMHLALAHLYDPLVQSWDLALFGTQVSATWHLRWSGALLSSVLHTCYLAYYGMVFGVPLFLYLRRSREDFARAGFIITLALYACYLAFALFPVNGPRYQWGPATGPAAAVLPARLVHALLAGGSAWGTAFPSSHIAVSWCAAWALWRPAPRAALLVAPVALGLALATVYGQFHYGVDALAGALTALLLCAAADPLRRRLTPAP